MSKVTVINAIERRKNAPGSEGGAHYESWIPVSYTADDLKRDAARYWQLQHSTVELRDGQGNLISASSIVSSPYCKKPLTFVLNESRHYYPSCDVLTNNTSPIESDLSAARDEMFGLFVISALVNPSRNDQLVMSKKQFKQILQRATVFPSKSKATFDTSVDLAVRRGSSKSRIDTTAITFDRFLDALMDIAILRFPKLRPEEALQKLLTQFLIPLSITEREFGKGYLTRQQIKLLLGGTNTQGVIQRFSKHIGDLAAIYSTSITAIPITKRLNFDEFRCFLHELKPKSLQITSGRLAKVFYQVAHLDLIPSEHLQATPSAVDIFGKNYGSSLSLKCCDVVHALSPIAWHIMTAKTKKLDRARFHEWNRDISDDMRARVLKALLYQFAIQLRDKSNNINAKSAQYSLARSRFLQEFDRMHYEDKMEDYHHNFLFELNKRQVNQDTTQKSNNNKLEETATTQVARDADVRSTEQFDELSFLDEPSDINCDIGITSDPEPISPEQTNLKPASETSIRSEMQESELTCFCNQADEMYAFLTSELLRFSNEKRDIHDTALVEPMLDIWSAAGEAYSRAIQCLSNWKDRKSVAKRVELFVRWGISLEMFAVQVIKHTTTVDDYASRFGITNPRVFSVQSSLWSDFSFLFAVDLATESISLASAKLSSAIEELAVLLGDNETLIDRMTSEVADEDSDDSDSEGEQLNTTSVYYEKYITCIFHRANCLSLYGDIVSHGKPVIPDYEIGCALEEQFSDVSNSTAESTRTPALFTSGDTLTKSSSAGVFYNEARKMYTFLLSCTQQRSTNRGSTGANYSMSQLLLKLGKVQFKLSALLPQGCVVERSLLNAAFENISAANNIDTKCSSDWYIYRSERTLKYVRDIIAVRQSFFQAEACAENLYSPERPTEPATKIISDGIVPFYRFILAAAFHELDTENTGALNKAQISKLNKLVQCDSELLDSTFTWLTGNFEASKDGITERGFLSYFCWLAEMDPNTFRKFMDELTSRYTDTEHSGQSSHINLPKPLQRATSLRPKVSFAIHPNRFQSDLLDYVVNKAFLENLRRSSSEGSGTAPRNGSSGIAESVIVFKGKLHPETIPNISRTRIPSEVRLHPELVDVLPATAKVPKEVSTFCFPDSIFLLTEWTPPRALDVVLTDDKGSMLYASCLHFVEEQDPMNVLALISSADRYGSKTTDLPPWISLRGIQQDSTQTRYFLPKCICLISSVPLFKTFQKFLVHLYHVMHTDDNPMCETPEASAFRFLQQIHIPPDTYSQVAFKVGDQACLISGLAPNSPLFYPNEVEFHLALQHLSPENIVKAYSYLLTEKKVVLCAKNKAVLTHVAETFRALLHPFECQQVYIPLLPLALLDFVTAPVPFFMGMGSCIGASTLNAEGVVVVDLDSNEIRAPSGEVLPILPDAKARKIIAALRKINQSGPHLDPQRLQETINSFGTLPAACLSPMSGTYKPVNPTDAELAPVLQHHDEMCEKWAEFQGVFMAFNSRLIRNVRKFCTKLTGGSPRKVAISEMSNSVDFDKRAFLNSNQSMREFYAHLFQTQLFQRFLDNFDAIIEQLEPDQSWRGVRSISSLRRHLGDTSSIGDDVQMQRSLILAPLPPFSPSHDRLSPGSNQQFDSSFYEELALGRSPRLSKDSPTRKVSASEKSSMIELTDSFLGGEDYSSPNLVSEAKKKRQEKKT